MESSNLKQPVIQIIFILSNNKLTLQIEQITSGMKSIIFQVSQSKDH